MQNQVRIVGGKWRGRKISIAHHVISLRPTQDRIRETLFNWLMPVISHANCLDLFAGSGALGFEALSRGAEKVFFIDSDLRVIEAIKKNAQCLGAMVNITIKQLTVPVMTSSFDELNERPFDIIFLDPPYHQGLILPTLKWLLSKHYLHSQSLIYFEAEKEYEIVFPQEFALLRHQTTTTLQYGLLRVAN